MVELDVDRGRSLWWVAAIVLVSTVLFVVYSFVGTFVFGLFIYYATRPAYRRIRRRVAHRTLAATLALLVFALPAIVLLIYTMAIAIQELSKLQTVDIGPVMALIQPYIDISHLVRDPAELLSQSNGVSSISTSVTAALGYLGFIGTGLLHLFVMFALAFYLLRDGGRLATWVSQHTDERAVLEAYIRAIDRDLQHVFFGNILNAIMTGAIGAISFSLLNFVAPAGLAIPYPALLGLLAGVASLVPVVGMKLVYVPIVGYLSVKAASLGTGLGFVVAVFLVALVVVDTIPDLVLRPYVSGRNLHVGMVMFAYILGPLLFGWYGIILGPLVLVVVFHFVRMIGPELVTGNPIKPEAVGPSYLAAPPEPAPGVENGDEDGPETDATATRTNGDPQPVGMNRATDATADSEELGANRDSSNDDRET